MVNLTDGRRIVSVVAADVDAGPINLVVSRLDPRAVSDLRVDGRSIVIDGTRLLADDVTVYRSALAFDPRDLSTLRRNLRLLTSLLNEVASAKSLAFLLAAERYIHFGSGFERELARHIETCVHDIFGGDLIRGVTRIRGCGFGLTPSGDDFIVGLLVALRLLELATGRDLAAVRSAVAGAAETGNALSATFISLAADGLVFEGTRNLVSAFSRDGGRDVRAAAEQMVAVGSTSGADVAVGLCMGLSFGLDGWPGGFVRRVGGAGDDFLCGAGRGGEEVVWS